MHVRTGERGFETMSMEYQVQENCLTIFLPKEVDHHNAEEVKKSADAIIEKEHIKYVIFDFEQTDFMDSSGIGVIMGRYRMICLIGGEVWAVHANARIRKILTMSGVTKIMQIYEEEQVNPTVEEVSDVKTAVSEAVTNAIIHGYDNQICKVSIRCSVRGKELTVEVRDTGKGIENIKQAMTPMYTSKPELERSGMGFSFMEAFMDNVHVISEPGEGTRVIMKKSIGKERETWITQSL